MWTHRRSGLLFQRDKHDHRDPYERDRTRVIHSAAFRRLQRKTQILGTRDGDFHRTRLTHSLEVGSIGCSIVRNIMRMQEEKFQIQGMLPPDDLINTICLLHDIGHPPFGHGGEAALNFMMRHAGGFEANAQTLRLLSKIEGTYGDYGLDLTRRTMLGTLKYPVAWDSVLSKNMSSNLSSIVKSSGISNDAVRVNDWLPPKAYFKSEAPEVSWILSPFNQQDSELFQSAIQPGEHQHGQAKYHSFDCSIMDVADNIAYGIHDMEDAIHERLIKREDVDTETSRALLRETPLKHHMSSLFDQLFNPLLSERKQAIGALVNYLITSTTIEVTNASFENSLLRYNVALPVEANMLLTHFIQCIYQLVIDSKPARIREHQGQTIILQLFEAMSSRPMELLDDHHRACYLRAGTADEASRVICDHIANMTDEFAYRVHKRLFGSQHKTTGAY